MSGQNKLWGGRFEASTDSMMEQFSQSVQFDKRLYNEDINGSMAHARMLLSCGILSSEDVESICQGLEQIRGEIERDEFQWSNSLEDVHMNIESALTAKVGDAGKKLHTGRSRNDQIATDLRLYLRGQLDSTCQALTVLQTALVDLAKSEASTIMPGFTHMQPAQPVTCGHHLLAWNEMLERDYQRFQECRKRINISPLGCAALAGTSYPIDREMTAVELGFSSVSANSLDAVSDRDFVMEFNACAAFLMVHLSRISEELVLWSSPAFDFIDLGDAFCTGSSIMPQKKNPDVAEITRGKSARVIGNLVALLTLMKGQPLSYNRDNQEDKEPIFDTVDTIQLCIRVYAAMFPGVTIKRDNMKKAAATGYSTATDLADYLVRKNIPFRDAHEIVGKVVSFAIQQGLALEQITLAQLHEFCDAIDEDVFEVLTLEGSVAARNHIGGTAPDRVLEAAQAAGKLLDARASHPV